MQVAEPISLWLSYPMYQFCSKKVTRVEFPRSRHCRVYLEHQVVKFSSNQPVPRSSLTFSLSTASHETKWRQWSGTPSLSQMETHAPYSSSADARDVGERENKQREKSTTSHRHEEQSSQALDNQAIHICCVHNGGQTRTIPPLRPRSEGCAGSLGHLSHG